MATVTEILDRASRVTGLRTSGSERTVALQALQNAYRRAMLESECDPQYVSYTIAASSDDYDLATVLGATPVRLMHVSLGTSGGRMNLQQVSMAELLDNREREEVVGLPCMYATIGFDRIAFWPNPSVGDTVRFWYLADTPTLVESGAGAGEETTPSKVPVSFHWDILLPGTVLELLDKDQRNEEASFWGARYERGIARLMEHIGQMGGEANRAYLGTMGRHAYYRDERIR